MKEKKIKQKKNKETKKVKFPINIKLEVIFSLLVIFVLGFSTIITFYFVSEAEIAKAEENNLTLNSRTSLSVQNMVLNVQSNTNGYFNSLAMLYGDSNYLKKADALYTDLNQRNDEILFVYTSEDFFKVSYDFGRTNPDCKSQMEKWLKENQNVMKDVENGAFVVENLSPIFKTPALCTLYSKNNPLSGKNELIAVAFDIKKYSEILSTGSYNSSFLVNKSGKVLIHTDSEKIVNGTCLNYLEAVEKKAELSGRQTLLSDENGNPTYYAIESLFNDTMFVITSVSKSDILDTINHITLQLIFISLAVLFFAIIVIRIFSKTITKPIGNLAKATIEIEKGNYDIELKSSTKDEIGTLELGFAKMVEGLKERNKLFKAFSKYVNPILAEQTARNEQHLGGEKKFSTIFFSDIRSFTAMSEKMTPREVVGFLNKYMTKMVECVAKTGGLVDKYIGDAIMAVWGGATTCGSPEKDAWAAVRSALMMRIVLYELNQKRIKEGRLPIKIGCGINSGEVISGNIGSEADNEKMEYTVIGDAVNLASRSEALNKPFGTDIIITENTYNLIKDKVIVEPMPEVSVKGKEKPIQMYAVINAVGTKGFKTIDDVRNFLGIEAPDLAKVDPDAEEKKYKIKSNS